MLRASQVDLDQLAPQLADAVDALAKLSEKTEALADETTGQPSSQSHSPAARRRACPGVRLDEPA